MRQSGWARSFVCPITSSFCSPLSLTFLLCLRPATEARLSPRHRPRLPNQVPPRPPRPRPRHACRACSVRSSLSRSSAFHLVLTDGSFWPSHSQALEPGPDAGLPGLVHRVELVVDQVVRQGQRSHPLCDLVVPSAAHHQGTSRSILRCKRHERLWLTCQPCILSDRAGTRLLLQRPLPSRRARP